MSQVNGDPVGDRWQEGEQDAPADALFDLPPDHVVVALRARTGFAHLGWRRPSDRERLHCAAYLASEQFHRGTLAAAESIAISGPSRLVGTVRSSSLLTRVLETDPARVGGAEAVAAVLATEELLAVLHATQARYLSRLAEPGVVGDPTELAKAPKGRAVSADTLTPSEAAPAEPAVLYAAFQLATAQLGAALCVGPGSASRRISDAQDLVHGLPAVREALSDGRIDPRRARILLERSAVLAFELRTDVADRLLPLAPSCTPSRWASMVDAAVIAADPVGAEARRREAIERRRLRLDRADDGMATFIAELSAPDAQLAWDLFDAIGQALKGLDDRCIDHRRADAFSTMIELLAAGESVSVAGPIEIAVAMDHETCCDPTPDDCERVRSDPDEDEPAGLTEAGKAGDSGRECETRPAAEGSSAGSDDRLSADDVVSGGPSPAPVRFSETEAWNPDRCASCGSHRGTGSTAAQWTMPTRQGRRTHATVVLTLETLAAIVNDPAALVGHGVITAELARTLAEAASSVSLLIGDPETGAVLGAVAWKYRPHQHVRDQLVTAYQTCIFTGCDRRCDDSDFDHRNNFRHSDPREGGTTTARNVFPLCRLHHRLKTFTAWTYHRNDRTVEFRSPLGFVSTTRQIDPVILHGSRADGPEPPDTPPPF